MGYVQSNQNALHGAASVTVTFSSANTAGNLIVVSAGAWSGGSISTTPTVTDTQGNTYTLISTQSHDHSVTWMWYAKNIAAGSNTVTVPNTATDLDVVVAEYSGIDTTSPLDTSAGIGSFGIGPWIISGTASSGSKLMVMYFYDQSNATNTYTLTPATGWAGRQVTANPDGTNSKLWDNSASGGAFSQQVNSGTGSNGIEGILAVFNVGTAPGSYSHCWLQVIT